MNITPSSVVFIVVGLLLCLTGWYLFRFSIKLIGLVLGVNIGYSVAVFGVNNFGRTLPASYEFWIIIAVAIIFGVLGMLLIKIAVKAALFLSGFIFGAVLVSVFTGVGKLAVSPPDMGMVIENLSIWSLVSGAVFGILFLFFEKGLIILYTCSFGAFLIVTGLKLNPLFYYIITAAGAVVQFRISKGKRVKNMQLVQP